jgi:hypothetical protein
MSETPQTEQVEVEESSEEKNVFVVDPDDYQKTKKLEIIHNTKQEVLNVRNNRSELIVELGDNFRGDGIEIYQRRLAKTVAQYGSELLPLIEEGLANGTLEEDDLTSELSPEHAEMDVLTFIKMDGRIDYKDNLEYPPGPNSLAIYRQLDRIQRKLGLGLELQEDKGPASI